MPIITDETVRLLWKELYQLREEEAARNARIAVLERKLAAAAEFGFEPGEAEDNSEEISDEGGAGADSLPDLICGFLERQGRPVKPPDMKRHLISEGVAPERFGKNNGYFYTVLGRLVKRGRLRKRGKAYRIVV